MDSFPDKTGAEALKTLRWGTRLLNRVFPRLLLPRVTIRILPDPVTAWWYLGEMGGSPAMQVVAELTVTNVTDRPASIRAAYITKPKTRGSVLTPELNTRCFRENGWILPGETTTAHVSFWVQPPAVSESHDFIATVVLMDQFGNKHKAKNVPFHADAARSKVTPRPTEERLSTIIDPVEKMVATVLKAEIARFLPGRMVAGQFGTVCLSVAGRMRRGFETEWCEVDAPTPISIYVETDDAVVSSENADALLRFYATLDAEARSRFVQSLLRRIVKDTEYEYAGYFVTFVLYRLGKLQAALTAAKQSLRGGKFRGFQDALCLLDWLLKFEHRLFTNEDLDWIESYVEDLDEYTFSIKDRIRDIRVYRMNQGRTEQPL